ncbi:hypothetical protein [Jiangella aurantiaca]|nr:hypothetical protein [Jiangella aurantiaca]
MTVIVREFSCCDGVKSLLTRPVDDAGDGVIGLADLAIVGQIA